MNLLKSNLPQKTFKEINSLEKRKNESKYILEKYPDKVPIIIERSNHKNAENIPDIKKEVSSSK